jgi:hypothetical protein
MTLEHLVVYGGIVVGCWLIGIVTFLAFARQHRPVLRLDMQSRPRESATRGSAVRGWVTPTAPMGTADQGLATWAPTTTPLAGQGIRLERPHGDAAPVR